MDMQAKKFRIGFVGGGAMGQMAHLSNYVQLADRCEVVAIAEARPELAQSLAARYNIPHVYADHLELLQAGNVDAIVAPQPFDRHYVIVPDILRAGIPLFTEKALALTYERGQELAELASRMNTLYMVGYHKRSDLAMEYAKRLITEWQADGSYGGLRYIRVTMPPGDWIQGADMPLMTDEPYPTGEREEPPYGSDQAANGAYGHFVNYYIHQANAIRYLLGEKYQLHYVDRSDVLMVGSSTSGVCVTLEMAPYHTTVEWHESLLVCFEKAFIRIDLPAPLERQHAGRVTVMKDNGEKGPVYEIPVLPHLSAMRNQALNFLRAVSGESPAPCDAADALEDLLIARQYVDLRFGKPAAAGVR